MPDEWLVDEPVTLVRADGTRIDSAIRLGFPSQVGPKRAGENAESSCWSHVGGLLELGGPVISGSTLGALTSALEILADVTAAFTAAGGGFADSTGADAAIDVVLRPLIGGE